MLSRLVCSIWNRSTCGVNITRAGKWPFFPIGATKPGPRKVEFGSGMFGLASISRAESSSTGRCSGSSARSAGLAIGEEGPGPRLGDARRRRRTRGSQECR